MTAPLRRLMKEAAELNASPTPHFHAAPISDSNLFEWHFTLAGPPAPSAYAGGIYHGRIVLPPTYPLRPPSFRFLTPSGRFEVNREICLSISGHHEELWQPAWGIRTSLLAIRSFMDGDAKGQVGGMDASWEARREYAGRSAEWVCEVCGRKNEEILGEWREECRGMGVEVDDEGDAPPQGDTQNSGDGDGDGDGDVADTSGTSTSGEKAQQPRSGAEETENAAPVSSTSSTQAATTSTTPLNPASPPPSSPLPAQHQQQHPLPRNFPPGQPPAASPLQAAAAAPPPVPATATQAHPGSAAASQSNSNSTPWLDRAIFGLFIALLVMILRRIARDE
ncbi:ubiquitin-conjugating enzyme E2 [Aspergillus candidus]|uniref:Ubiquitin-conjugating enzyme/RWD-like protein n=1 Tax=Aspergillus candidus TaxID=41067 RepID=A0A2I2FIW9_ASPCN|nr:ubiquitin-conjugating enzyme/RWD-like protein [Aspergillus candidus]PLB40577.1 ubiquitin-conjugating enzyme/RWD-like protein [Aspergillus candidus]